MLFNPAPNGMAIDPGSFTADSPSAVAFAPISSKSGRYSIRPFILNCRSNWGHMRSLTWSKMEFAEIAPIAKNIKNLIFFFWIEKMEPMPLWTWPTSTTPPLKNNFYLDKGAVIRSSSSEFEKKTVVIS